MFRIIIVFVLVLFNLNVNAVETLDVTIIYDSNTINNYHNLDKPSKRDRYSSRLVANMNATMKNSGLESVIQFSLKESGSTKITNNDEKLSQIRDIYIKNFNLNINNPNNSNGKLYAYQKHFKSDIVIGVIDGSDLPPNNITCGAAIGIPDKSMIDDQSDSNLVNRGPFGLFFIQANDTCYTNNYLASHEFAHTVGIYHGEKTDGKELYDKYKLDMLVKGASGYYRSDLNFQTVMSYHDIVNIPVLNQFSDKENYSCDTVSGISYLCGNKDSNAVETIRTFASDINKRGDWYQ